MRTFSRTVRGSFRNADIENQEPSGDCSQNDAHLELEFSACRASNLSDSGRDETSHMVTRVQEEILYCSPGTSLGNEKKARFTGQPQICSGNNPAENEGDQVLLAFNNWQVTVILQISTEYQNCLNPSLQQCLSSMGNHKILKSSKNSSEHV